MEFTGERLVLGKVDPELEIEHINRYVFAKNILKNKNVLDAACGTGYGTAILSSNRNKVVGIDISEESINYAAENYLNEDVYFRVASIAEIPFADSLFDGVVSFETIEHVNEETQNKFLKEIKRVLKKNGILIMSTPNHGIYKLKGENHFHVKEFEFLEFKKFLERSFKNVRLYSQQFEVCNVIVEDKSWQANVENGFELDKAEYIIAVCSDIELPNIKERIYIRNDDKYKSLMDWAVSNHNLNEKNNKFIKEKLEYIKYLEEGSKNKEESILNLQKGIAQKNAEIETNKKSIYSLKNELKYKEESLGFLKQELINKEGHIELLLESDRELERIKESRSWKFIKFLHKIVFFIIPKESKRRLVLKMAIKSLKSPSLILSRLNLRRIKQFFYYLNREGASGVSRRLDECFREPDINPVRIEISGADDTQHANMSISDYKPIEIAKYKNPMVTIVIPVYNQFEYTYKCIKSIQRNSGDMSYEIIIADDCSTDLTVNIKEIISGIIVIRNKENLRFLKNCNNAAKFASGKYILFLNNDTQVQSNWLKPLVDLIEEDEKIGMVGSKLIYPDGRLQEAGGILWNDASAWNYGHLEDPNEPEYNYVREVDYISGAAILIKHSLWDEIGGFDEKFVPAYCEDSDLAFEVRKHGYKVMYQPLSVVVHFEGISNGTDTSSGQKAYQIINQKKFYEKWRDVLEKEHFPNGENVFVARDRSRNKKTVVVVDHYVPTFDKDAGSRTVYQYIRLFVDNGFNVKFIGDNFYQSQPYTTIFQQMGIEILYGPYYANNWKKWVKDNREYIQYFFLNRPHITVKYIDVVKNLTDAKIIYYGHDLHFLREFREYELTNNSQCKKNSGDWKKKELSIMKKADCVYYPSYVEVNTIKKIDSTINAKAIPAYIFDDVKDEPYDISNRKDIMFIGGFNHKPNVDAVVWFAKDILPILKSNMPNIKVHVLGSNAPEEICKLGDDNLIIDGFVTDEELVTFYKSCRISIVPLRYGAGIKGKVIEAMKNGVPVVTTSVGAEGIVGANDILYIADDPLEFANCIKELYNNEEKLKKANENSFSYIRENFSPNSAIRVISEDFEMI